MSSLKFSVAMSVYQNDSAPHFDKALESITVGQSVKPNEIVLIVDGPVGQDINAVIEKHEGNNDYFKVIRLSENVGLGNALRLAVEHCSYDLIARMDSDDVALPDRFAKQLDMFNATNDLDIVGGDISEFIGDESNIVAYRKVPVNHAEILSYMQTRCPFNHMTVMYKKAAVLEAGGYQDLFWNEDYFLWIRMAEKKANMANTGTVLVNVRTGLDMYQRRGGKRYFQSELFLQKYMLERNMIRPTTYVMNVGKRWILQCLLPNRLRGWVFRNFARKKD